jgi:hypothetical protein
MVNPEAKASNLKENITVDLYKLQRTILIGYPTSGRNSKRQVSGRIASSTLIFEKPVIYIVTLQHLSLLLE